MLIVAFFSWWYGKGWAQVSSSFIPRLESVASVFSVNQLLHTLFAPWRRIITYPGASLEEKFKAWADNILGRTIGMVVRLFVLFAALVVAVLVSFATLIELVLWPILPFGVLAFIILGIIW
jgi:hypothetical protein